MSLEETAEMACSDPETLRERLDATVVERTPSIRRSARSTVVRDPFQAGENGAASGRHLRHGRKPAASAAAADG
jgi:hypothetical protein